MDSLNETLLRPSNAVAAGTTAINGDGVDLANYEGVKFYFLFGTITATAVTSCKAQQSSDDDDADAYADIEGSAVDVADDDDNQVVVIDVKRPRERYVRPVVSRGTANAVLDGIIAVRYGPRSVPTSEDAAVVVARNQVISPAEGTA